MNKNNLISLIVLDVVVMILAIALLAYRYQGIASLPVSAAAQQQKAKTDTVKPAEAKPQSAAVKPQQTAVQPEEAAAGETAAKEAEKVAETRNISFVYKNSRVKKVEVIGDFTQWAPVKMAKGAHSTWKLNVALAPGEYAYNFVIDGKPRRDPNNPKVCNAGRGFPNSSLKVKSLANENQAD
jgi:Glycogen recognition site of AMP-activated protein kinase